MRRTPHLVVFNGEVMARALQVSDLHEESRRYRLQRQGKTRQHGAIDQAAQMRTEVDSTLRILV